MFTNIKLLNLPPSGECTLLDMGRINVICGKNNSGKSTVLRAFSEKEKRAIGKQLSDKDINEIVNITSGDLGFRRNQVHITYAENGMYTSVLIAARDERRLWFANEADEFTKEV